MAADIKGSLKPTISLMVVLEEMTFMPVLRCAIDPGAKSGDAGDVVDGGDGMDVLILSGKSTDWTTDANGDSSTDVGVGTYAVMISRLRCIPIKMVPLVILLMTG